MKTIKALSLIGSGVLLTQCGSSSNSSTQENVTICSLEVDQGIYDNDLNYLLGSSLASFDASAKNEPQKSSSAGATLSLEGSDQNVDKGDVLKIALAASQVDEAFTGDTTYISFSKILSKNETYSTSTGLLNGTCKKDGKLKISEMTPSTGSTKICVIDIDKAPFDGLIGKSWKSVSFRTTSIYSPTLMPIETNPNGLVDVGDQVALFDTSPDGSAVQADGTAKITFNEKTGDISVTGKLTGSCTKGGTLKVSAMTAPAI